MAKRKSKQAEKKRLVKPQDLTQFKLVGDPQITPAGDRVVFVVKHVNEKNQYATNLWMVDSAGKTPPRPFTSGNKDTSPRWSPDGSRIAFHGARDKLRPQIFTINAGGGEASPLTDFPEGSLGRFAWSPDGKSLAVSFRERDPQQTEAAKKEREEKGLSTPPHVINDWWYRLDGDGYFVADRFQLYLVDGESGEHRCIETKDTLGNYDFDWSPDSTELVLATNRDKKALIRPWKTELLKLDVATGKTNRIENLPEGPKSNVCWSPDGKWIAYAGREGGTDGIYSTENLELYVCDPRGRNVKSLTGSEDYCLLSIAIADTSEASFEPWVKFSPDSSRVFTHLGHHGEVHVASVGVTGGSLKFHTTGQVIHEPGNFSSDGRLMSLTTGTPTRLSDVAVAQVKRGEFNIKTVTDLNAPLHAELKLASPTSHWVTAEDGHKVHVWMMKPPGLSPGKKTPAVLEVHGGPHAQYGWGLFHEFQVLAAAGYTVFYGNPRGSKGYGRDHCAAISGDWGKADWMDVQAVAEFIESRPQVDASRVGIMGGSYGGYMTNWAIGHTDRFAAAITDRCVSNLVSMSGNSDWIIAPDQYFPGNAWDRSEERWRQSPLAYFANVKTPTLVIHSEGDLRCNIEQGEQVFAALKLLGVPTRMVRYPAETSHGMSRQGPPDLRMHRLHQILDWWATYLK